MRFNPALGTEKVIKGYAGRNVLIQTPPEGGYIRAVKGDIDRRHLYISIQVVIGEFVTASFNVKFRTYKSLFEAWGSL